jgi:hypothetical protein
MDIKSKRFIRWIALIVVSLGVVAGIVFVFNGTAKTPSATNSHAPVATNSHAPVARFLDISIGQNLTFHIGGSGLPALQSGWSTPESWGTWSDGDQSTIALKLTDLPKHDPQMVVKGLTFLFGSHQSLIVKVDINGTPVASITYLPGDKGSHSISVPRKVILSDGGRLLVHFAYDTPKSPKELGKSGDVRKLGLGLSELQFNN